MVNQDRVFASVKIPSRLVSIEVQVHISLELGIRLWDTHTHNLSIMRLGMEISEDVEEAEGG